jgi:phage gp29-like protein
MPAATPLFNEVALEQVLSLLSRLPDPDLVLAQQGMGRQELRKLETDDEVSAALETRADAVVSTPWRLEPFESEPTQWLASELEPHMESLLRGLWSAVPYGYSVLEVVYRPGPRIGIAHIQEKPLEWFEPRRDGTLWYTPTSSAGVGSAGTPVIVDSDLKFILTRRKSTYRNPYGEALLSRIYWPWFFRHNGWRFWMRFLERFAEPLLLGQVANPEDFVTTLGKLGYEAVAAVGIDEKLTSVTQSASGEFEKIEMALGRRIQKLVLGQTLTSEVGDKGSYAAAQVHNEVRQDKKKADIRLVTGSVQRLVNALWALNSFPGDAPEFVMADDTGLEVPRAERDAKLVQAGVLRLTPKYLLDRYDFKEGDFELPTPAAPAPARGAAQPTPPQGKTKPIQASLGFQGAANPQRFTQDQAALEALADSALAQAKSPVPAALIREAILAATSPDDLAERLAGLYGGEDLANFQALLEQSLFAADVLGYTNAEQRVGGG